MKEYGKLFVLMNYVLIVLLQFLPDSVLWAGQALILAFLIATYFIGDNKSVTFLNKIKYPFILNFMLYVFLREPLSGRGYFDYELSVGMASLFVFLSMVFFTFILLKIDRMSHKIEGE